MNDTIEEMTLAEKVAALTDAGFRVQYATANEYGYVGPYDVHDHAGYDGREWVSLEAVAAGEDRYNQVSTWHRSNYRSLHRDYPGVWTDIGYSNVNGLGAFVEDLTPDLIEILGGLAEQYPIYDESDLSELESDDITESYDQYLRADMYRDLTEDEQETLDGLDETAVREAFWDAVSATDYYPGHDGLDVRWDADVALAALRTAIASLTRP